MTDVGGPALRCRACGRSAPVDGPQWCEWCFAGVEVVLDPATWPAAPPPPTHPATIRRWAPLLPGVDLDAATSGGVPIRPAPALGAALGLDDLWLHDETASPTGSFKDRVVDTALGRATRVGRRVAAATSTGTLARALAVGAARRDLAAVVLVPDHIDPGVAAHLAGLGAVVVPVRGGYDGANRLGAEAAMELIDWGWVNVGLRPWYELGAVTAGLDLVAALGWRWPDRVVVPVASGALALAVHRAASATVDAGWAPGPRPRLTPAQPAGCAPLAAAWAAGSLDVAPVRPATVAASLAMGDPPDGPDVLVAVRATGGAVGVADEDQIAGAAALVAEHEGIAVEPAGGVAVAALASLRASGAVDPGERVVVVLTGGAAGPAAAVPSVEVAPGRVLGTITPSVDDLRAAVAGCVDGV
ncbi:MAG TPA: pyridoxal-phosphate dependent enzyme [Acidimicrobiales bacterium]|nr:pyridoxal-phosphate dependent enzyme [Acidimicrobiales bacterium]